MTDTAETGWQLVPKSAVDLLREADAEQEELQAECGDLGPPRYYEHKLKEIDQKRLRAIRDMLSAAPPPPAVQGWQVVMRDLCALINVAGYTDAREKAVLERAQAMLATPPAVMPGREEIARALAAVIAGLDLTNIERARAAANDAAGHVLSLSPQSDGARCTCLTDTCDCQDYPTHVSMECPVHNQNPMPRDTCPVHGTSGRAFPKSDGWREHRGALVEALAECRAVLVGVSDSSMALSIETAIRLATSALEFAGALPSPPPAAEKATAPEDTEARRAYEHHTDNHPTIHSNRFLAWSELTEEQKQEWRRTHVAEK